MYLNILKKDLKRKKSMNIILLVFVILAVMFVSSSVNNLIAVTNSLDTYFEKANMSDYIVATRGVSAGGKSVESVIKELDYVQNYYVEDSLYLSASNATNMDGEKLDPQNMGFVSALESSHINFFDNNNNEITEINDNEMYVTKSFATRNDLSVGDKIKIKFGDKYTEFTITGYFKDAFCGSSMMGTPRLLISQNSFGKLKNDADKASGLYSGQILFIDTDNVSALEQKLGSSTGIVFQGSRDLIKTTYIMDMLIAGVLLVVSICLILIAFVMLRFTITFTLSEEYREIGIMKAIGIKNNKIRGLYLVKYFVMSVAGAIIGFIAGIPFGNMFLQQASENIMMTSGGYLINIICAVVVIGIIMLFCYRCTAKVKKFTPVDAIRNGSVGERFKRKSLMKLSKSKLRPVPFMAANDILCGIKRFVIMSLTFTTGLLLITIILNTMTTLQSDKLVNWFSIAESDVYITDANVDRYITENGRKLFEEELNNITKKLKEKQINSKCFGETMFKLGISKGEYSTNSLAFIGTGTTTDQYEYLKGTAPQNTNEVALTYIVADKIHAEIGDTVTIRTTQGDKKYVVSAIYQSMNNMGEGIRFHQDEELDFAQAMGSFGYQVRYTDNPSEDEKKTRLEQIKELFPDYTAYLGGEYVDYMDGGVAGYMDGLKNIIVIVVMLICILVAVLMEKSFLTKEKGEIAMLKAVGFRNSSIIFWQTLRTAIVMLFSVILAIILSDPLGQLAVGGIFRMMGAYNIIFDVNILETYVVYPLLVFAVTVFSVFIVAQQIRKVSSSEINSIE